MISDWVTHHQLLFWLFVTPFIGLAMGWFGRTTMGLFGKHGNAPLCALSGIFWAFLYLLLAWSESSVLRGVDIDLGPFLVRYIPLMLIAACFAFWLAKRYGYAVETDDEETDNGDDA